MKTKTKTTKVYKVIYSDSGRYWSALVHGFVVLQVEYKVGKWSFPHPKTKLFAFTNKKQALDYADRMSRCYCMVFEAQAKKARHNGWLDNVMSLEDVQTAFEHDMMPLPLAAFNSCVVCDAIKLVKQTYA